MKDNITPVVIRSNTKKKTAYLDYRDDLRHDFWYSCAYCSMTELESCGISFEIDHYLPQSSFSEFKNDYQNLMWSCSSCNNLKRDYYPGENEKNKDLVIIRPDEEDPSCHFELNGNILNGITKKGEFNIDWLYFNSLRLRRLRDIRRRLYESKQYIKQGVIGLSKIKLDQIDKKHRVDVLKMIEKIKKKHSELDTQDQYYRELRDCARSHLIDHDEEKKQRMTVRKKYLKNQKAIDFSLYDSSKNNT